MTSPTDSSRERGLVPRVTRWCITRQATDSTLKGTESERAQDLRNRDFPAESGDVDQIAFHTPSGRITDAA